MPSSLLRISFVLGPTLGRNKDGDEYVQVEAGEGIFAQYGTDFEEHSGDLCSVSSAIVEMPDGSVRNMPLHMIRFLEEDKEEE